MTNTVVRTLIALLIAAYLGFQATRASGQPHRRRAFGLAAVGLLVLAGYNLAVDSGVNDTLAGLLSLVGLAFMAVAAVFYVLSWRGGEMTAQRQRFQSEMQEEVRRRKDKQ